MKPPPNERRWTVAADVFLAVLFAAGAVVAMVIPVTATPSGGDRADCGTAFFANGPQSCNGATTPFVVVAILCLLLAALAVTHAVRTARRR